MKKQIQKLERLNAPQELIDDFIEKYSINEKIDSKNQSTTAELLEDTCRKFAFYEILENGWFFRPSHLSGESHRGDTAVDGTELEAPAIEQAYRRGFAQGFAECRRIVESKSSIKIIRSREVEIARWRKRNIQRFQSCPGDAEKFPKNLFSGRSTLRPSLRWAVLKRDGYKCVACGVPAAERTLEVDHIHPVSKGGNDTLENLRALCRECNVGKSDTV